jgi:hypothetical protein
MSDLKYTPGNFLKFHVKKGTEFHSKGEVVVIRSTTFDNVQNIGKPLIVTAQGEKGIMVLRPEDMRDKVISITRKLPQYNYHLMYYKWEPIPKEKLELLDYLYTFKYQFDEKIETLLNSIKDGIKN